MRSIGVLVTTFNRPWMLERALPQIVALGSRVLVVDDGSEPDAAEQNARLCREVRPEASGDVLYLRLPENRGLAAAMNIGLSFWLCDPEVEFVSYLQDDVEVDPLLHEVMMETHRSLGRDARAVLTGHDAKEHAVTSPVSLSSGIEAAAKDSCRATQMFASRDSWISVMPIASRGIGYPKRVGSGRGKGSNADWWVVRDAPRPLHTVCVPGLVRTFAWTAEESTWGNTQKAGEDAPLTRGAITAWLENR